MTESTHEEQIRREAAALDMQWKTNPRWYGIERTYAAEDVIRLRGSISLEHTLAGLGAERLWSLMGSMDGVAALGALTGAQAVEMVKAGLQAIYLSGWQVAADANLAGHTYPDQSLYPACRRWSGGSTTRCNERIRSRGRRASAARTGSRRSWPMPKPGSAGR